MTKQRVAWALCAPTPGRPATALHIDKGSIHVFTDIVKFYIFCFLGSKHKYAKFGALYSISGNVGLTEFIEINVTM